MGNTANTKRGLRNMEREFIKVLQACGEWREILKTAMKIMFRIVEFSLLNAKDKKPLAIIDEKFSYF